LGKIFSLSVPHCSIFASSRFFRNWLKIVGNVCRLSGVIVPVSRLSGVIVPVSRLSGVIVPASRLSGVIVPASRLSGVIVPVSVFFPEAIHHLTIYRSLKLLNYYFALTYGN
jgi:hypothetical protein